VVVIDSSYPTLRAERRRVTESALRALFERQRFDVLMVGRVLGDDWDAELADRMFDLNLATATVIGERVAEHLPGDFSPVFMHAWLRVNAQRGAVRINDSTREDLDVAIDVDGKTATFEKLRNAAPGYATAMVTTAANFGAHDAAYYAGGKTKTWTGGTTRHSGMNGQTVPLGENFSNGMAWPGDPAGGAAEVANCGCSVTFN
jgi:hypothetical protein